MAKNIAAAVRPLVAPAVADAGCTLWDVEYVKEGTEYYLRITIDKAEGVTINDCEKVHRAVDKILDDADPIDNSYHLEISSPGIERELRTDEHIAAFIGSDVDIRLFAALDGRKDFLGTLTAFDGRTVTIVEGDTPVSFERKAISKIKTVFCYEEE